MKNAFHYLCILLLVNMLGSCQSALEKKSEADFQRVQAYVRGGEPEMAMQLLDSMTIWYKQDYGIVGEAMKQKSVLGTGYYTEALRKCMEDIGVLEPQAEELARHFRFTPGEGGRPGVYEHRRQTAESSWNRTFLKVNLNEKGYIWLTSHYYGKEWIDHTSLRVYDSGSYVLSDTIPMGDPWNRKVEDLGDKWETIDFHEGTDAGIIAFIADNYRKPVKARFNGRKFHYIVMEQYDREAFHYGWKLAQVLKEIDSLRQIASLYEAELARLGARQEA